MTEEHNTHESDVATPEKVDQTDPQQEKATTETSVARRVLRWIFRMLVTIFLGIALGASVYYGVRSFYRDAIEPLQTLDQRMLDIESSVKQLQEDLQESQNSTAKDVSDLEAKQLSQVEELAALSAQISRLELRIEDQDEALDEIVAVREGIDLIQEDLALIEAQVQALEEVIEEGEIPAERVEEALQLMRAMNLLTRARLWIEQDNYGLASEDIEAALEIMQTLTTDLDSAEGPENQLLEITDRLTLALEVVRTEPALAEEELEIVWKLLIEVSAP